MTRAGRFAMIAAAVLALFPSVRPAGAQSAESLYERIGGYDVIAAVVDDFFGRFDADPQLAPFLGGINAPAAGRIRQHFVDMLCARTGGPCVYNGRDMKSAHEGLPISGAHFDAVIRHFAAVLEAKKVPPPATQELLRMLRELRPDVVTTRQPHGPPPTLRTVLAFLPSGPEYHPGVHQHRNVRPARPTTVPGSVQHDADHVKREHNSRTP